MEDVQEVVDGTRESSSTICTEESEAEHRDSTENPRNYSPITASGTDVISYYIGSANNIYVDALQALS